MKTEIKTIPEALYDACQLIEALIECEQTDLSNEIRGVVAGYRSLLKKKIDDDENSDMWKAGMEIAKMSDKEFAKRCDELSVWLDSLKLKGKRP